MQFIAQKLKRISVPDISRRRSEISECLADLGITLDFFNGGGTGSLRSSARDETLTELTVGSGYVVVRQMILFISKSPLLKRISLLL
jgi:hypothetical protein